MDNDNEIQVTVTSDDSQGFTVGDGVDGVILHEDNHKIIDQDGEEKPRSRNKERSARTERLRQENAALRRQNEEMVQALAAREDVLRRQQAELAETQRASEQAEVDAAEQTLSARETAVLGQIKYAKEEGLVDDEILLTKKLAQIQADKSALALLSDLQGEDSNENTYFQPEPSYRQPVPLAPQLPEAFYEFLDRNPDVNPESRSFNKDKLAVAESLAKELSSMMTRDGVGHKIGTDDFYDIIESAMCSKPKSSPTLGVSRDDQLYDMRSSGARNISKEELSFIRNLPVYLDDGTEASEQQKIERYLNAGKNIQYRSSGSTRVV